ncbi:hypothetical protein [Rhizobium sp. Rhizsp42]|uniref:hypothetical protein n=1 Tax=Rhizobium sp. Rhizsp42 TaxID=3243034 RepID=UPI0039B0050E
MNESSIAQLILTLIIAGDIAPREDPGFDIAVYRVRQAIEEIVDEALKHGIVVDTDQGSRKVQ